MVVAWGWCGRDVRGSQWGMDFHSRFWAFSLQLLLACRTGMRIITRHFSRNISGAFIELVKLVLFSASFS